MKLFPKKIAIKDNCSIDGVVPGKRLGPGLYIVGKNLDEDAAEKLMSPEFSHAVEAYKEKTVELAAATDAPVDPYEKAKAAREAAKEAAKAQSQQPKPEIKK